MTFERYMTQNPNLTYSSFLDMEYWDVDYRPNARNGIRLGTERLDPVKRTVHCAYCGGNPQSTVSCANCGAPVE